ncbi:MAG: hypothetical protein DCC67_16140 [Planctomycetota bacterium]|nr:MAG: hypothetical protein DCC67_16140 [Planctomycetota bacterium]
MPTAEAPAERDAALTIDLIIRRAESLYTLPAVAVEVLRLTESPKVDVRALKACIERDPALTVKILRVVNSSLFGLPREVSDLNQALALLGIKPLKLLALGFSLPESLFLAAARDQLDWFWRSALVRAVAAREISEHLFGKPGDDAFLAGLLQDLGVLVLLGQFGRPYAMLLNEAIASQADLNQLEQAAIGFPHQRLTAALLEHWNLPPGLVAAIAEERDSRRWARSRADHAHLVRVLHLAELLAQLVGQRRLSVLPDLLQTGEAYCLLDRSKLNDLIAALEPKVRQLADVLSLKASETEGYAEILIQAHQQMSAVAETVAAPLSRELARDEAAAIEAEGRPAPALARQLRASFEEFFALPPADSQSDGATATCAVACLAPHGETPGPSAERPALDERPSLAGRDNVAVRLTLAVGQCRSSRTPLSVVLLAVESSAPLADAHLAALERSMHAALRQSEAITDVMAQAGGVRRLMILAGRDRLQAVGVARSLVERIRRLLAPLQQAKLLPECTVAAGVAWVDLPAKNFQPQRLVETAERCLAAAMTSGGVKSLEVS